MCYKEGIGVEKDFKKAFELWNLSTNKMNIEAQNYLGECYLNGIGVDININKAIELFTLSAYLDNNMNALYNLGICYKDGNGVDKDMDKAFELIRLSANQGNVDAEKTLCYNFLDQHLNNLFYM